MNRTPGANASQVANGTNIASWELPFDVTLTVLMTYLTTCQLLVFIYDVKKKKIKFDRRQAVIKNIAFAMNLTTVLAGIVGVSHYLTRDLYFVIDTNTVYFASRVVSALFSYSSMYFVLWLKQIHLYINPAMSRLATPIMRYTSYLQGVIIGLLGPGFYCAMFCILIYQRCDNGACIPSWLPVIFVTNQFQNQIALLVLFSVPLIKHKMSNNASSQKNGQVMALVKRTAIATAVSIAADLFATGFFALTQKGGAHSVGILLNYLCIILCYKGWRERLFPCLPNRIAQGGWHADQSANPETVITSVKESTRKVAWK